MKGSIFLCISEIVKKNFGDDKWEECLAKSGFGKKAWFLPTSDVDDAVVLKVVDSMCKVLGITLEQVADAFGEHWVNVYTQKMYKPYYRNAETAKDFLLKLDSIHQVVTSNIPGAKPPRFEYEWKDEKTLIMKYKSHRGLIDFAVASVRGVAKLYKENLRINKIGNDKIEVVFP